jgi:anti-anti-sigma factor
MGSGGVLAHGRADPVVVILPAEFNVANAWPIGEKLVSMLGSGSTTVIVDLAGTNSCDSAGLAVLTLVHYKAVAHNAELRLVAPSAAVRRVLMLAGLDRVLRIYLGMAEALSRHHERSGANGMEHKTGAGLSGYHPALLVPDPARPAPGVFRTFATASALLRFADGLNGFCSSRPDGLDGEHNDLISAFFDDLRNWIDVSGERDSISAESDVSRALDGHMKDLARVGFTVEARERFLRVVGGIDAERLSWRIADIKVQLAI